MKNLVTTVSLLIVAAVLAGVAAFRVANNDDLAAALARKDALEWLRADFDLTEAQFAAITQLHESYAVVCEQHCQAIQEAVGLRNQLKGSTAPDRAALAAAETRVAELTVACETAIASHVRACAELMSPAAGQRYLALVLPKIKDYDHQEAPDVRLNHQHRHGNPSKI